MNTQTIIAIVLAVVTGIAANLMTPYFRRFPSFFSSIYTKRQIANLERELSRVIAWRSNLTDFYLYLLHMILWIFMLLLIIIMLSIFVAIAPKFYFVLLALPASIVYVMVRLHKTMMVINAVRNFNEYQLEVLERLKVLKEKVK